jgi:hypothetical protein
VYAKQLLVWDDHLQGTLNILAILKIERIQTLNLFVNSSKEAWNMFLGHALYRLILSHFVIRAHVHVPAVLVKQNTVQ